MGLHLHIIHFLSQSVIDSVLIGDPFFDALRFRVLDRWIDTYQAHSTVYGVSTSAFFFLSALALFFILSRFFFSILIFFVLVNSNLLNYCLSLL